MAFLNLHSMAELLKSDKEVVNCIVKVIKRTKYALIATVKYNLHRKLCLTNYTCILEIQCWRKHPMRSLVDDECNYLVMPPVRDELEETCTTTCSVGVGEALLEASAG